MIEPIFYTKIEDQSETFARFIFAPLHPSFGHSMGNAFRRTLLSSLRGAAIGQIRVEGVPHLFSTIKGVKESVLDMVLNMKQLRFDTDRENSFTIKISAKGQKKIYGRDVEGEVAVINKDLYLGELTDDKAKLEVEAVVETGYGYVPAEAVRERSLCF
jgi:DNA-directed RNA polymerase subunit alpha